MKILVMRPSPEGKELSKYLNNLGIPAWHFSLFNFFSNISSQNILKNIYKLYNADIIIVFSKRAIHYTNICLKKYHLKWPSYPTYYAIGKGTSLFLHQYVKKKFFFLKK